MKFVLKGKVIMITLISKMQEKLQMMNTSLIKYLHQKFKTNQGANKVNKIPFLSDVRNFIHASPRKNLEFKTHCTTSIYRMPTKYMHSLRKKDKRSTYLHLRRTYFLHSGI